MKTTQHTPAPWFIDSEGDIIDNRGRGIAFGRYRDGETGIGVYDEYNPIKAGDARLIAAAPDLLAALQGVFVMASNYADDSVDYVSAQTYKEGLVLIEKARAAIAKAKGE